MPHTLERVDRILLWLEERQVPPVTLLVVPGLDWEDRQIARLHDLAEQGHELAAHGWLHQTKPRRLFHRIHSTLISRNVAEHLDLDSGEILALMTRSRNWFDANKLPLPDFYVPPAWALGPISKSDLLQVPYTRIETTRGFIYLENIAGTAENQLNTERRKTAKPATLRFQKLPLTGYEADTAFREFFLRRWNAHQAKLATTKDLTLRISIHPDDLDLRVADQLDAQIGAVAEFSKRASHIQLHKPKKMS